MLHNIEELKKAHEKSIREAEEANRISLALPVVPIRVGFADTPQPWVTYEVKTLCAALDIFKHFTPSPYVIARDSNFTVINTEAELLRKYGLRDDHHGGYEIHHEIDGAPYFDCTAGTGFSTVEMEFFTNAADRDVRVAIKISCSPINVRLCVMDAYKRTPSLKYRKEYPRVPGAKVIHWGYGEDCCKGTYWFSDLGTFWDSMATYEGR